MKKKPYRRKCGDYEIRVLSDGRIIMLAPDDALMEIARTLDPNNEGLPPKATKRNVAVSGSRQKKTQINTESFDTDLH
jgi:hypothetical protein